MPFAQGTPSAAAIQQQEGLAHLRSGRCLEAAAALTAAAEGLADHPDVWTQLGASLVGADQSMKARDCFTRSLALAPRQPEVWNNLGMLLLHAGENQAALDAFQRSLALQPGLLPARRNACLALYALGRDAEAEALLPESSDRSQLRGQALRERGELEAATEAYREAIRLWERAGDSAPAHAWSPFSRDAARRALFEAQDRLDGAGLPFRLWAGTLLGVVRNGDLLDHDKDLDLAMDWDVSREAVVTALCAGGLFSVPWFQGILPSDRPWHRSFVHAGTGCTLDVFFLCPDGDSYLCGFDHRPIPVVSRLTALPQRDCLWSGRAWRVPDPPEHYLAEIYGPSWRVPDPTYDTVLSNPTRTPESLPVVVCMAYFRLFEALVEGKGRRARALVAQILRRREDPFLIDLLSRIERRSQSQPAEPGLEG